MSAGTSSLVVASQPNWTTQTITAPAGSVAASLGALYLDHPTDALSIFAQLEALAGVSSVTLRRDGLVSITLASAGALTWGSATTLRDLLGFTGDRTSAATHVADTMSPLLWVPMREEIPETVLGLDGATDPLVSTATGRDGYSTFVYFGGIRSNTFQWRQVPGERYWTASEGPGEYATIYYGSIVRGHRFLIYREVEMDDASSSAASYSSPMGPYQIQMGRSGGRLSTDRASGFEIADVNFDVALPVVKVPEYA